MLWLCKLWSVPIYLLSVFIQPRSWRLFTFSFFLNKLILKLRIINIRTCNFGRYFSGRNDYLAHLKSWIQSLNRGIKGGGSEVRGYPWLLMELKASLENMKPFLRSRGGRGRKWRNHRFLQNLTCSPSSPGGCWAPWRSNAACAITWAFLTPTEQSGPWVLERISTYLTVCSSSVCLPASAHSSRTGVKQPASGDPGGLGQCTGHTPHTKGDCSFLCIVRQGTQECKRLLGILISFPPDM